MKKRKNLIWMFLDMSRKITNPMVFIHHWRWLEANGYKRQAASCKRQALELTRKHYNDIQEYKGESMQIKKFLNKKTSKKTKISILEKMLKECEAGGGTLSVKKAKQIITAYVPEKVKHENS